MTMTPFKVAGLLIVGAALLGLVAPNTWPIWTLRVALLGTSVA
jgi:hypothetical protein